MRARAKTKACVLPENWPRNFRPALLNAINGVTEPLYIYIIYDFLNVYTFTSEVDPAYVDRRHILRRTDLTDAALFYIFIHIQYIRTPVPYRLYVTHDKQKTSSTDQ